MAAVAVGLLQALQEGGVDAGAVSSGSGSGSGRPSTTCRSGVEEQDEAGAAGVDHAGLGQHGQLLGRAGHGVGGRRAGGVEHGSTSAAPPAAAEPAASAAARATVRIVPSTGRITAP